MEVLGVLWGSYQNWCPLVKFLECCVSLFILRKGNVLKKQVSKPLVFRGELFRKSESSDPNLEPYLCGGGGQDLNDPT